MQADHKIIIGGSFTTVGTTPRNHIARLNADGTLDTNFLAGASGANSYVNCVAVQPDGKVLVGGYFTTINGTPRERIARLTSYGSVDTAFGNGLSGANDIVESVTLQRDGKILISGRFSTVNGISRTRFARLNSDGSVDTSFQGNDFSGNLLYPDVITCAIAENGKTYVGGAFTTIGAAGQRHIARLHGDSPQLQIAAEPNSQVRLSWALGWDGFSAEAFTDNGAPWNPIQQQAISEGTNWLLTLPQLEARQFFRLRR